MNCYPILGMNERAYMCLVMMRSGLEGIGELLDQLDRNFGEDHWERISAMEAAVRLGWTQLPDEFRPGLATMQAIVGEGQAMHLRWSEALDEVRAVITGLEPWNE